MDAYVPRNVNLTTSRATRLRSDFGTGDAIGHVVIWIVLTVCTLGLALIFFPYYMNRAVLNRTKVIDQAGGVIGYLNCRFDLGSSIAHVIIWMILILITLGIAAFFYLYRVLRVVINETYIVYN